MSEVSSLWWTDERIEATLCRQYVFSQLQPEYQSQLFQLLPWGEGLTSETYLEWILTKAGKLFLILIELGIPHRIFNLADDCVDDSDLPFAESRVRDIPLTQDDSPSAAANVSKKFFLTQWRYLVRGIAEGEHVKYTGNEGVPVEVLKTGLVNTNSRDGVEKVVVSGAVCRVFLRTQVPINSAPSFSEEDEVLEEIRTLRQLAHEHVFSIYGSYFVDNSISILFNGVYDRTLMSFLTDTPQNFKRLPKPDRREILVNWPHCLVNGLAWLHANGHAHGFIRPSNILVDSDYRIFLGHFEALDTLLEPPKINDIEAYQYAPPERWIRTTAIQEVTGAKNSYHSGGRTTRLTASSKAQPLNNVRSSWMTNSSSQSSESRGTVIRVASRNSLVSSTSSSASGGSGHSNGKPGHKIFRTKPILYTPSITSSNMASDTRTRPVTAPENAATIPFVPHNTALVRTWQSQQADAQLSDIFSLGAVITDIMTLLCERKISSFANHRSAKNRTPGRGGGVADASFHLVTNLPQVSSWLTLLTQDSKKRKGLAFRAVEPMLAVVRDMVARSPEKRPTAEEVEARFAHTIRQLEGILLAHCKQTPVAAPTMAKPTPAAAPVDLPLPPSPKPKESSHRKRSKAKRPPIFIDHNSDSDIEPAYLIENTEKKARQKKAVRALDLGYDFDFPFANNNRRHHHQQQQNDGYSPTTDSSSNPPSSSGGSSIHHDHMKMNMDMSMNMMKMKDKHRTKHKNRNMFIKDKKDKGNNAIALDDTIYHLRKALEERLDMDERRYFDEMNMNLPRYEA